MIKAWITAFRLRTLPLAFASIITGAFVASYKGYFDTITLLLTLATTLFLQILSNLANDYGDAASGVDGNARKGPERMVQSGKISRSAMKRAIYALSGLSFISGIGLIWHVFAGNWGILLVFFAIGLASIWAAIRYTAGSNPYGYAGLGDLFVLIFFGLVGVGGTYFLFAETFDWMVILPALSSGLLAVGVLNINNIRDIESDRLSGKRSIPVRIGKRKASFYHMVIIFLAVIFNLVFVFFEGSGLWSYLFLLTIPLLFRNVIIVLQKQGPELDPFLKQLALTSLVYSLLFGTGLMLSSWI